ncbi:sulfatase [Candidatus Poribacteria bacterium]|nr:sulfatase [Candidatus Poribacteria bacterium]
MNVAFIVIDTLRYDYIGANGNDWIETPNIDRFASKAWAFDRAFCASFPTIPYRTDVITGQYGAPFHAWKPLRHERQTLPRTLAKEGYATQLLHDTPHLVNGGHNFDWPFHAWTFIRGAEVDRDWIMDHVPMPDNWVKEPLFDCLDDGAFKSNMLRSYARANRNRKTLADWNCAKLFNTAAQFLKDNAKRENFFLWVDCFDPHEPWDAPPEFMKKYDKRPSYDGNIDPRSLGGRNKNVLSDVAKQHIKDQYAAKLTWMDHCFGEFVDALEATGLDKNTAVILTGDHGTNVGERGSFGKGQPVREQEGHVPLFVRLPEGDTGRSNVIVQPQDFFPTILNILGIDRPDGLEGHDFLTPARENGSGEREIALSGGSIQNWTQAGKRNKGILFTAFDQDWNIEVSAKPENSRLIKLGSIEYVQDQHQDVVAKLHAAAVEEISKRGIDPALMKWLRSGGEAEFPSGCSFFDGYPGPEGYSAYFGRLYPGE